MFKFQIFFFLTAITFVSFPIFVNLSALEKLPLTACFFISLVLDIIHIDDEQQSISTSVSHILRLLFPRR